VGYDYSMKDWFYCYSSYSVTAPSIKINLGANDPEPYFTYAGQPTAQGKIESVKNLEQS
jgi:hypothetical protein